MTWKRVTWTPTAPPAWRQRAAVLGILTAATLILSGCATAPVEPIPYERANTTAWFSGSTGYNLSPAAKSEYDESRQVYDEERYAEAVRRYKVLAGDGVPDAAYELGKAYRFGRGVPRDPQLAAQWFIAAVSKSHSHWPHASYHLGEMFLEGEGVPQDDLLARRLLQQALDNDIEQAALPLAKLYAHARGVDRDIQHAEQLALRGAEAGDGKAYLWLLRGYGPEGYLGADPMKANAMSKRVIAELTRRVREEQDPEAMRDLAMVHYEGLGVPQDPVEAAGWLDRAAQAGRPDYLIDFGEDVLLGRDGFAADPQLGFRIVRGAAERYGDAEAMALVGEAYFEGLGTPVDRAAGEDWLRRASEAGSLEAALDYGRTLAERRDDPEALRQAAVHLERAAEAGMPYAWAELGELHLERAFPGARSADGVNYLSKAHDAGIASATYALGKAYLEGRSIRPDPGKAAALLEQAAKAGQGGASITLGQAYLEGEGLPRRPQKARKWLEQAAAEGNSSARMILGRAYMTGQIPGNPLRGKQILTDFARQGDGFAMMELGRAYRDGGALPPNHAAARHWFQQAERAGVPGAQQALASLLYLEGTQEPIQVAKLQRAAEMGHDGAMAALGRAYLEGEGGVAPSTLKGMAWLHRAVDAGNMGAAQTLGAAYLRGDYGLDHDPEEGRRLLERAAAAGDVNAERDLGYALVDPEGTGLRPNLEQGMRLLTQAARKGDVYAMELLGKTYLEGTHGVAPRPEDAKMWLSLAASKGDLSSMTELGSAYVDGEFAERDVGKGLDYLQQAAARGDDTARVKLGSLYLFGTKGLPPEPAKGLELIEPAVDNGHPGAMATLGRAYVEGTLGRPRIDEGARLLFDAARAGHPTARVVLAEAYLRSQGLESANRDYAEAWLDTVTAGDTSTALQTLTDMLRDSSAQQGDSQAKRN